MEVKKGSYKDHNTPTQSIMDIIRRKKASNMECHMIVFIWGIRVLGLLFLK
jgi:hypothetical protein